MNIREISMKSLRRAITIYGQDLEAIPAEAFNQSFGGKSRTVADMTYEVNVVNQGIMSDLRGEPKPEDTDEGWLKAPADLQSKEAVISSFHSTAEKVTELLGSYSDEEMLEKVTTAIGEVHRFECCRFIATHLFYHSGQLNYIQTMLGDDVWNWK